MAKKLGTLKVKRLFLGTDSGNRGTEVTSSAAELNVMDGVTATATELNYLDITTLGTGAASKAVVLDAGDDFTWPATGVLTYGGTGVTANGAELNYLDITTLGTGAASKAVVLDAGEDYTWPAAGVLTYGGTGITATGAELNLTDNMWASVTTVWVDGTDGTGTVQFTFKDAAGTTMTTPIAGEFYISEVATGLTVDALDTGLAVLTNGVIDIVDTGAAKYYNYVTTAAGLLGATITSNADSYWIVFKHPTGKLVISDELAITGP
jgi:hypothetical protein